VRRFWIIDGSTRLTTGFEFWIEEKLTKRVQEDFVDVYLKFAFRNVKSAILLCAMLLALCLPAEAQQPKKVPRIGFLSAGSMPSPTSPSRAFLLEGLQALGYVEGKNILIEYRFADNKNDRLPDLVAELIQLKVDVIFASSTLAALPAKAATGTIPIVALSGDPVGTGLVDSLARPGGNVTGVTNLSPDLSTKRLEVLKEVVPAFVRIAVLWDAGAPAPLAAFKETQEAARALGLQIQSLEIRAPKPDIEGAFKAAIKSRAGALLTISNPLVISHRAEIVDRAGKDRLPAMYADVGFVDAGWSYVLRSKLKSLVQPVSILHR
jgi:putative ABC transport system substrate-binding protein